MKCDFDCFNCKFPDCKQNSFIPGDAEMLAFVEELISPAPKKEREAERERYKKKRIGKTPWNRRRVICTDDGKAYDSVLIASYDADVHVHSFYPLLREGRETPSGKHFRYLDEWEKEKKCLLK